MPYPKGAIGTSGDEPVATDLMPEEDFSAAGVTKRRWAEIDSATRNASSVARAAQTPIDQMPRGAAAAMPHLQEQAAKRLTDLTKNTQAQDLSRYPELHKAVVAAIAGGANIRDEDVARLINVKEATNAAKMLLAAANISDETRQKNILATASPVMRSAIYEIADNIIAQQRVAMTPRSEPEKAGFDAVAGTSAELLGKGLGFLGSNATSGAGSVMNLMNEGWENTQHLVRSMVFADSDVINSPIASWFVPARIPVNWGKTGTGQLNEGYITSLKESGQYSPVAVDILADISRATAAGDAEPIISTMTSDKWANNPEADLIFRKLIYRNESDPQLDELARQIDSANQGSSGQILNSQIGSIGANPLPGQDRIEAYSAARGSKSGELGASATSIGVGLVADPFLGLSKVRGAYLGVRYALNKLAPGMDVASALASRKIAGVETNATRIYFSRFAKDLTKLDDLEQSDKVAAGAFRQLMARQYKDLPDDVIEEFRKQGVRTVDDISNSISESNAVFKMLNGDVADEAAFLMREEQRAAASPLERESLLGRIMESSGNAGRREALMPRLTIGGALRQDAARLINQKFMPSARAEAVMASAYSDLDPVTMSNALNDNYKTIGKMDASRTAVGRGGAFVDRLTRMVSSLPSQSFISLDSTADAGTFYKLARGTGGLTKRHADVLTEAFRAANPGQRRLLVAGVVRTGAAARGVNLSKEEVLAKIDELVTGGMEGEQYAASRLTGSPESVASSLPSSSPKGLLEQAIAANPSDSNLKSMLDNIENGTYGQSELDLLDKMVASVAVDDAGKFSQVEDSSGLKLLAASLSGDPEATALVEARLKVFRDNVSRTENEVSSAQTETYGGAATPAEFEKIAVVHSTKYGVERTADGDVFLNPNAAHTAGSARSSVHFTINSEVKSHMFGQWDDTNKLIVTNTKNAVEANGKPAALNAIDSWWKLSPGQKLRLPNPSIVSPYVDEAKYAKELEKRGLIGHGDTPPVIVEDSATNEILYFSKAPEKYTDADRIQIAEALGKDPLTAETLIGKESEILRRNALDRAMRQQGVNSGPESLGQWDFNYNKDLSEGIDALRSREGIYGGIHQGTPAGLLELTRGVEGFNRFTGNEIETYRWLAAQGMLKSEDTSAGFSMLEDAVGPASPMRIINDLESTTTYNPAVVNGQQHALHVYQTAKAVAIPSIADIEAIKAWRAVTPEWLQNAPQNITNLWSLGTLYGFRFSQRSMVEDMWTYVITGGSLPTLLAGRKASTAVREATPIIRLATEKDKFGVEQFVKDSDGNLVVIVDSRLGMFNKRLRGIAWKQQSDKNVLGEVLGQFMAKNLPQDEIIAAFAASRTGDMKPLQGLVQLAFAKQVIKVSPEQQKYILRLVGSPTGLRNVNDFAETARYINQGTTPKVGAGIPGSELEDVRLITAPEDAKTVFGNFIDVPMDGTSKYGNMFWHRNLLAAVEYDGPIGKIAVANLYNKETAVQKIVDAINADKKFGYKQNFSMLYTGEATVEEFARRYFDDVYGMFSGKNGINRKLWQKIVREDENGKVIVSMYDRDVDGNKIATVTQEMLGRFSKDEKPAYVLGREVNAMPMATSEKAMFGDKAWGWMGEQYARISKEPIFYANYIEQSEFLQPLEKQLTEAIGEKAAARLVTKWAEDRAYAFSLSYTDNPMNRSVLAWKVRNVARYYRATEDFYRRMGRIAKNYPIGFWRTALTYQLLDETGFVYTDQNGEKYFAYPGNEMLMTSVNKVLSIGLGNQTAADIDPFMVGGKITGLAPSSDPKQALPMLSGPLGVIGFKMLFDRFDSLKQFEKYITGDYSVNASYWDAILPASISRVLKATSQDERDSLYGSAMMDSIAIATVNDMIPAGATTFDDIKNSDLWPILNNISIGIVGTKLLMSYFVPASPQVYTDNVTAFARAHGLPSMRQAFLALVQKYSESDIPAENMNPMGAAMSKWYSLHPDGNLMPFTVSQTKNKDIVANLANVQATDNMVSWYRDNKWLWKKYPTAAPEAAMWLAPRDGKFTWDAWQLATNELGLKEGKDFNTFATDVLASKTQFEFFATIDDYAQDIARQDPRTPEGRAEIAKLEADRKKDLDTVSNGNAFFLDKNAQTNWSMKDRHAQVAFDKVKSLVSDMYTKGDGTETSNALYSAILTYEDYMSDIRSITGTTNADDQSKRELRYSLERDLAALGGENENVQQFVTAVLNRQPDFVALSTATGGLN